MKYALIKKYDKYTLALPISYRFRMEYDDKNIYTMIYLCKNIKKKYQLDKRGYCNNRYFKLILRDKLENLEKSNCKKCGKFTYCIDYEFCLSHEFNYCGVLDYMLIMSFIHKNRSYIFH